MSEALKFLVGARDKMRRTLLSRDLWSNEQSEIPAATPRAGCMVCQERDFIHLRGNAVPRSHFAAATRCRFMSGTGQSISPKLSAAWAGGRVKFNRLLLRFERGDYTVTLFGDGRAIVQGTTE